MCEELGTLLPSESELPYSHLEKKKSTDHDVKRSHKTRYLHTNRLLALINFNFFISIKSHKISKANCISCSHILQKTNEIFCLSISGSELGKYFNHFLEHVRTS